MIETISDPLLSDLYHGVEIPPSLLSVLERRIINKMDSAQWKKYVTQGRKERRLFDLAGFHLPADRAGLLRKMDMLNAAGNLQDINAFSRQRLEFIDSEGSDTDSKASSRGRIPVNSKGEYRRGQYIEFEMFGEWIEQVRLTY